MTTTTHRRVPDGAARTGASMAIASMLCVQLGLALSVGLVDQLDVKTVVWLRLTWAAVIMLIVLLLFGRRQRVGFTRSSVLACVGLGVVTGMVTMLFMAAIVRLPLGTASALEFLGPLTVAVVQGRGRRIWPILAGVGVLLLTEPWRGGGDLVGVALALGAAVCWAAYILLTQRVGDEVVGIHGLAVSLPVAAIVASAVAGPAVLTELSGSVVLVGLGLAVLLPVVPFTLELLALRRLTAVAFGTLMSLEPAFALVIGLAVLHQVPDVAPMVGIGFVVLAGVGAARGGGRAESAKSSANGRREPPIGSDYGVTVPDGAPTRG